MCATIPTSWWLSYWTTYVHWTNLPECMKHALIANLRIEPYLTRNNKNENQSDHGKYLGRYRSINTFWDPRFIRHHASFKHESFCTEYPFPKIYWEFQCDLRATGELCHGITTANNSFKNIYLRGSSNLDLMKTSCPIHCMCSLNKHIAERSSGMLNQALKFLHCTMKSGAQLSWLEWVIPSNYRTILALLERDVKMTRHARVLSVRITCLNVFIISIYARI